MSKLLFANFSRLWRDPVFWLCALFMLIVGVFVALKTSTQFPLERCFFVYALLVGLVSAVFCGLFLGTEHGDGVLRNKIIVGHTKSAVYLANMLTIAAAALAFCLACMLPLLAVGLPRLGGFEMSVPSAAGLIATSAALAVAYASVYTLIAMACRNKAVVAVACLLCFIALLCAGARVNSWLQEPEFIDNYVMSVNGGVDEVQKEPNPAFLSGTERQICQFVLDFLPGGQSLQFVELTMVHTWQLPLYSLIIIVLTTAGGVVLFRKKNVN